MHRQDQLQEREEYVECQVYFECQESEEDVECQRCLETEEEDHQDHLLLLTLMLAQRWELHEESMALQMAILQGRSISMPRLPSCGIVGGSALDRR